MLNQEKLSKPHDRGARHILMFVGGGLQYTGRSLREDPGVRHDEMRIRFIDTDANYIGALPADERFILDQIRIASLLEAVEKHPHKFPGREALGDLDRWWKILGATESLPAGLMTRPELGEIVIRLVGWRMYMELRNFIVNPARELHFLDKPECLGSQPAAAPKLRLVVSLFFSNCGGTGSSMVEAITDLIRHLLAIDLGLTDVIFDAYVILPGPMLHRANDPDRLRQNAARWIAQTNLRYRERQPPLRLGNYEISRAHRPYRHIYLLGDVNMDNHTLASRDEVNDMCKEIWKLQHLGVEGQEYQSRLVDYHLQEPNHFSSAGAAIAELPVKLIRDAAAMRTAADWLYFRPLRTVGRDEMARWLEESLDDFLRRCPDVRDVTDMRRDDQGDPLEIEPADYGETPRLQVPLLLEQDLRSKSIRLQERLHELSRAVVADVKHQLAAETESILNKPGGIHRLHAWLGDCRRIVQDQHDRLAGQLKNAEAGLAHAYENLSIPSLSGWQGVGVFNTRGRYLATMRRLAGRQAHVYRQVARLESVKQILAMVDELISQTKGWHRVLDSLHHQLLEDHVRLMRDAQISRPIAVEWIICDDEIDAVYRQGRSDAIRQMDTNLRFTRREDGFSLTHLTDHADANSVWRLATSEGRDAYVGFFRAYWERAYDGSVEEILRARQTSPEELFNHLRSRAAPLVSVDETSQLPPERTLMIFGSETRTPWERLAERPGLSVVATGNPYRISLLYTIHRLNVESGLMQSPSWHQGYYSDASFPNGTASEATVNGSSPNSQRKEAQHESSQ